MTNVRIPYDWYKSPRAGNDDDRDNVDYTVEHPITVEHVGLAEFTLNVHWPIGLDDVRVTITLPTGISGSNPSIEPAQSGQQIDVESDRIVFTHPHVALDDTIHYRLDITSDDSGESPIAFTFDASELVGPLTWTEEATFVG